ncbi:hypothetical protein ABT160_02865 [Streptomyces sp. NPDC001941]|uniref:hypothetical protein n=1 Tax=Streptomyces sp. NPDC001941 TaxID=3154659 RepID=UPI003333EAFE
MRRGLVHAGAWTLATGAAVTLSWWGVHTVMAGTVYDAPMALPLASDAPTTRGARPLSSSTHRPKEPEGKGPSKPDDSDKGGGSRGSDTPPPPARKPSSTSSGTSPSAPPPASSSHGSASTGTVKSYRVSGGRAVFDIGADAAELISATPEPGWQMQVWKQPTWIRVTFTRDGREVSVFCTWHDHAPMVELDDR